MKSKFVCVLAFIFLAFVFLGRDAFASEGLIELRSTTTDSHKCFASSILMQDLNFLVAVTCRDLLYPADNSVSKYSLWAVPTGGATPTRIAELGLGRVEIKVAVPFSELYVVYERQLPGQKAEESIVMRGSVRPLTFLDRPGSPTPTPIGYSDSTVMVQDNLSFGEKVGEALKRAGVALFLFVIVSVGLVFVILKSKG